MEIPRLDPAASSFIVDAITINKRLRPYFEKWYRDKKRDGETPEEFLFRVSKEVAISYYLESIGYNLKEEMQQAAYDAEAASKADHDLLITEVE